MDQLDQDPMMSVPLADYDFLLPVMVQDHTSVKVAPPWKEDSHVSRPWTEESQVSWPWREDSQVASPWTEESQVSRDRLKEPERKTPENIRRRKNEIARNAREKKKKYITELEGEITRLREIEKLYEQVKSTTDPILTTQFYDHLKSGKIFQIQTVFENVNRVYYVVPCCNGHN